MANDERKVDVAAEMATHIVGMFFEDEDTSVNMEGLTDNEKLTALLLAHSAVFKQLTSQQGDDLLDFLHMQTRLAFEHINGGE